MNLTKEQLEKKIWEWEQRVQMLKLDGAIDGGEHTSLGNAKKVLQDYKEQYRLTISSEGCAC